MPFDTTVSRFPIRQSEMDRFKSGKRCYNAVASKIPGPLFSLDIGSGARPFTKADVLCDLYLDVTPQRDMAQLQTKGRPFVRCDAHSLPFRSGSFDFVTCYYLLEHVQDPKKVFAELLRVSRHGYIQSPSWFNEEVMYGEIVHQWVLIVKDGTLCIRPVWKSLRPLLPLSYVFHRLYGRSSLWRLIHAILDELLHIFTVTYCFEGDCGRYASVRDG